MLEQYNRIINENWQDVLVDTCLDDYQKHWFLDGETSRVEHAGSGMSFYTGDRMYEDADHGVLWSKDVFEGEIKITYDYTRLDKQERCVNILYLLAEGSDEGLYHKDISMWNHLRKVPAMKTYFNHMNLYHISYAAFDMADGSKYIRGRQYISGALDGTDLKPDYDPEDFFQPLVAHKITAIIRQNILYFYVENEHSSKLCTWQLDPTNKRSRGRIGFRQMYTRHAMYSNIKISVLSES